MLVVTGKRNNQVLKEGYRSSNLTCLQHEKGMLLAATSYFQEGKRSRKESYRLSGFSHFSPSERSQVIFSHVAITSPILASTIVFPVSREEILSHMINN